MASKNLWSFFSDLNIDHIKKVAECYRHINRRKTLLHYKSKTKDQSEPKSRIDDAY
jgi:hypothetical protein